MKLGRTAGAGVRIGIDAAFAAGPKYKQPEVTVPPNWQAPAPWHEASPLDHIPKGNWWTVFGDAELNQYEDQAMANNQSLKAGAARLAQARAIARVTAAGLYPELDGRASVSIATGFPAIAR